MGFKKRGADGGGVVLDPRRLGDDEPIEWSEVRAPYVLGEGSYQSLRSDV